MNRNDKLKIGHNYKPKLPKNQEARETFLVQASSATQTGHEYGRILINNMAVYVEKYEYYHNRGLHIVILNCKDLSIKVAKVFDMSFTAQ